MARPKMKFTPEEAESLVGELWTKIRDEEFCEQHLVPIPVSGGYEKKQEALRSMDALQKTAAASYSWKDQATPLPLDFPEQVRGWIETYITEAGWKRLLATRRQSKAARKRRTTRDEKVFMGPYYWELLAKELGIDKKELLAAIPAWLYHDDEGKAAFKTFTAQVHKEQIKAGTTLLAKVFELDARTVKTAVFESVAFKPERERELYRAAALAGKPKLVQLSKAFKKMPAAARLRKIASPAVELKGKSLLEIAATGSVKEALEGFVSSCDDAIV